MAEDRSLELPEHVVAKIQKVLGISPTSLSEHDLVSLIEDLCDTALMFDREEHGAEPPRVKPKPEQECETGEPQSQQDGGSDCAPRPQPAEGQCGPDGNNSPGRTDATPPPPPRS